MITNWCILLGFLIYVDVGVQYSSSMPIAKENNDVLYATQSGTVFTDLNQQNDESHNGDEYDEEEVIEYVPVPKKKSGDDNSIKGLVHRVGQFFANEANHKESQADPFSGVDTNNANSWNYPILFKKNLSDGAQALSKKIDSFYPDNEQDYGDSMNQMFGEGSNLSNEGEAPLKTDSTKPKSTTSGLAGGEDYADYLKKPEIPDEETPKGYSLPSILNPIKRVPSAVNNLASNLGMKTTPNATTGQELPGYGDDLQKLFAENDTPATPSSNGILPDLQKSFKKAPEALRTWMPNVGKLNNRGGADGQDLLNLSPTYDPNAQTGTKDIDNNESDQLNLEVRGNGPQGEAGPGKAAPASNPWDDLMKELANVGKPEPPKNPQPPAAQKPTNDNPAKNDVDPATHFPLNNPLFQPKPPPQKPPTEQPTQPPPEKSNPPKKAPIDPNAPFQPVPPPSTAPAKPANEPPPAKPTSEAPTKPANETPAKPANETPAKPAAAKPPIDPSNVFQPAAPQPAPQPQGTTPSTPTPKSPSRREPEPPPVKKEDPFGNDPFAGLFEDQDKPKGPPASTTPSTPTKPEQAPSKPPVKPASPDGQSPKPQAQQKPKPDALNPDNLFQDVPPGNPPIKTPTKPGTSSPSPKSENPDPRPLKAPPEDTNPNFKLPSKPAPAPSDQSAPLVGPTQPKYSTPSGKPPAVNPDDVIVPTGELVPKQTKKPPESELPLAPRPQLPKSASMPPLRAPVDQPAPATSKPKPPESQTSQSPSPSKPLPSSPSRPQRPPSKPINFSDEDEDVSVPVDTLSPSLQKMARPPPKSTAPDPKRLLQPSQTTKPQPRPTDAPSNAPLRLQPNNSKLPKDVDIIDDETFEIPISRLGGTPQEKRGFWARYFGIKWTPLGEILVPGLLDQTKRVSGLVGMPGVAGMIPGAQVAGIGANAIQKITGLPQVYENPSDSGRWARYIAGAFSLAGLG